MARLQWWLFIVDFIVFNVVNVIVVIYHDNDNDNDNDNFENCDASCSSCKI